MKADMPLVTIVMTVFNEEELVEENLKDALKTLKDAKLSFQFLVVDDGSTDKTSLILQRLKESGEVDDAEIVLNKVNLGSGGAIKSTLNLMRGRYYCWIPGDLEIHPRVLIPVINKLRSDEIVITYFTNGADVRSLFRNMLSKVFVMILNFSFSLKINYYNGTTFIPVEILKKLDIRSNRFFFHAECLIKALRLKADFQEMPILLQGRNKGKSKAIKFKVFKDVVFCYLMLINDLRKN